MAARLSRPAFREISVRPCVNDLAEQLSGAGGVISSTVGLLGAELNPRSFARLTEYRVPVRHCSERGGVDGAEWVER